jgi:hypothetical protein
MFLSHGFEEHRGTAVPQGQQEGAWRLHRLSPAHFCCIRSSASLSQVGFTLVIGTIVADTLLLEGEISLQKRWRLIFSVPASQGRVPICPM